MKMNKLVQRYPKLETYFSEIEEATISMINCY